MFDEILQWFSSHLSNLTDALVYCAIAGVTLIGVFKCLIPLITTTHALRRAITRLQQDAGTRQGTPVWQEKRFMGNRLKNCWLRFLQNAEQLDRRGLPCNVEDYINDDTVIHGPGNAQLADLIPGLLTSLGILGTFMGMMDGLGGLDFSNADKIIEGIPTLLTGMQFAFGTSVAGVSCSICFNIINRILQGSSYRAIDDFVSTSLRWRCRARWTTMCSLSARIRTPTTCFPPSPTPCRGSLRARWNTLSAARCSPFRRRWTTS